MACIRISKTIYLVKVWMDLLCHRHLPKLLFVMDLIKSMKFGGQKLLFIQKNCMQLAAYALAHNEMFGTDIHRGVVMIATRDVKYQEFVIEGDEFIHYETM